MPSKTISFVASGDLVEWLEEESDKRMTSMSSTVQQLLAEKYRREVEGYSPTQNEDSDGSEGNDRNEDVNDGKKYLYDIIEEHEDEWYEPASEDQNFAIDDGEYIRYYKTQQGLAEKLERMHRE